MKTTFVGAVTAALWGATIILAAVGLTTWAVAGRVIVASLGANIVWASVHHYLRARKTRREYADTQAAITRAMEGVERNIADATKARKDIEKQIEAFRKEPVTVVVRERATLNPGDILRVDRNGNVSIEPLSREN